jgi:hypothetical protein
MNSILRTALLTAAFLAPNAYADNLGDAKHILCSIRNINACQSNGVCIPVLPSDVNIPQFVEIDTKTGRLSTTAASGEDRETTASQVIPSEDHLLIHGDQLGRAFSLLIQKSSGEGSFASVADGNAVVGFSACTPRND